MQELKKKIIEMVEGVDESDLLRIYNFIYSYIKEKKKRKN